MSRQAIGSMLMQSKVQVKWLAALSVLTLLLVQGDAWGAAVMKPGVKRCELLQAQLTAAAKSKHMQASSHVKSLEAQAQAFCSQGKTAEGNRAYVKALTSLGIKPNLDTE